MPSKHERPPELVMVSGHSRIITARMIPSRQSEDLLAGHWVLLTGWGATPRALVWDNESAVGSWRAGRPQLTEAMHAFRGALGIKIVQCRPRDPESKGLVERVNGYFVGAGASGLGQSSGGASTGLRCWRCHRSRRRSGGEPARGWGRIITCVWTATTTRCIRR